MAFPFRNTVAMLLLSIFSVGSCVRLLAYRVPAIFLTQKPAWFRIYADFLCEPEGLSPDGGLFYSTDVEPHQTGEPRGPLPSGGKTSAKSLFLYAPARLRSDGCRGLALPDRRAARPVAERR